MAQLIQEALRAKRSEVVSDRVELIYSDDGVAYSMPTWPAGTYAFRIDVEVTETFDDSGTDELKVGHATDDDAYVKTVDVDLTALGVTTTFTGAEALPRKFAAAVTPIAQYDGQNGDATQGKLEITFSAIV